MTFILLVVHVLVLLYSYNTSETKKRKLVKYLSSSTLWFMVTITYRHPSFEFDNILWIWSLTFFFILPLWKFEIYCLILTRFEIWNLLRALYVYPFENSNYNFEFCHNFLSHGSKYWWEISCGLISSSTFPYNLSLSKSFLSNITNIVFKNNENLYYGKYWLLY